MIAGLPLLALRFVAVFLSISQTSVNVFAFGAQDKFIAARNSNAIEQFAHS
jgi:hypothetical protein